MPDKKLTVVVADDTQLKYSKNYQRGWPQGFQSIGCDVKVVDIGPMRMFGALYGGAQSGPRSMRSVFRPRDFAKKILQHKPDLVWFHHARNGSHPEFLRTLHEGGATTACYLCDEPYESGETLIYAKYYQHIFSMEACTVPAHTSLHRDRKNVWYLPPAAEHPFFRNERAHADREIPVTFLGNGNLVPRAPYIEKIKGLVEKALINYVGKEHIDPSHEKWVNIADHPKIFNNTRLGLNVHRDPQPDLNCVKKRIRARPSRAPAPPPGLSFKERPKNYGTGFWNEFGLPATHWAPRLMDMGACGVCVINDDTRSEIQREFDFVPQAKNPQDFAELVMYYLANPKEAEEIGCALAGKIRRFHTYSHRAAEILTRVGLLDRLPPGLLCSLGAPEEYLTPQDTKLLNLRWSSEPTGRSGTWNHPSGSVLTEACGRPSVQNSLKDPGPYRW